MHYRGKFGKMSGVAADTATNPMVFVMGFFFMLFSVLGGSLFYLSLSQKARAQTLSVQPTMRMVDVLIPLKDIHRGDLLDPALFEIDSRPERLVSSKAINSITGITGKYAAKEIPTGRPVSTDSITNTKPNVPISQLIPVGYRAVTIRVDMISSVEGWTRPGAIVDVHWIGTVAGDEVIKPIVERAEIISFGGTPKGKDGNGDLSRENPSTATLLVTKEDAKRILLMQGSGRISLSLRNEDDDDTDPLREQYTKKVFIGQNQTNEKCGDAKRIGLMYIEKLDGTREAMILNETGEGFVPFSKICPDEKEKPRTEN